MLTPHRLPFSLILWVCFALLAASCVEQAGVVSAPLNILIVNDGKQQALQVPAGTSVQAALDKAGVKLNPLDRVDPPAFSLISKAIPVRVIRVREEFEVKENVISYNQQTVRNESLPKDQELLIQKGVNGLQQETYRRVFEDGVQVSYARVKIVTLSEARPEIRMVGVQAPFTPSPIPGRLAYLSAGNAWVMEGKTGNRKPVVTTGDLDGYIFTLSQDGSWLLYSRKGAQGDSETINTLWAIDVSKEKPTPLNLKIKNVVHYAEWVPGKTMTLTYSTVEPRSTPPGWQANNDLQQINFYPGSVLGKTRELVEANSGGIYGWWGTSYSWSSQGSKLAYARPDGVGLVEFGKDEKEKAQFKPLLNILPLQTRSDWAWVPSISWSPEQKIIYTADHAIMAGIDRPEESPLFDVTALLVDGGPSISLVPKAGMFAYPAVSPLQENNRYQVAYLQAIFPEQSETSNYQLMLMDRDGSNRRKIFPQEGWAGMGPQKVVWSPPGFEGQKSWIGLVYQGNLWFRDPDTDEAKQVTGDGSISRIDWK